MAGYGYVKRETDNYVNWSQIGKDFSGMLDKVYDDREAKKKEIDDATNELMNVINNPELGVNATVNQYILDGSASTAKQLLMYNKEMKAGRLRPEDMIRFRQNIKDGWASFANVTKSYNQQWAEYKKRVEAGDKVSQAEIDDMARIEKFMDINNSKIVLSADGTMHVAKMKEGKGGVREISSDPNDYDAVVALANRSQFKRDRYDLEGATAKAAKGVGDDIRAANLGGGSVKRVASILQRPNITEEDKNDPAVKMYFVYEDNVVKAMSSDSFNIQSIITDGGLTNPKTGKVIEYTWDPNDPGLKNGDKILKKPSTGSSSGYEFVMTDDQKKQAENVFRQAMRIKLSYVEEQTPGWQPREPRLDDGSGDRKKQEDSILSNLAKLYYGNVTDFEEAASNIRGLIPTIASIEKSKSGNDRTLVVTYTNGTVVPIKFNPGGTMMTQEQWIKSAAAELGGIVNIDDALKRSQFKKGATFSDITPAPVRRIVSAGQGSQNLEQAWRANVESKFTGTPSSSTGADWAKYLTSKYGSYFTFEKDSSTFGPNGVIISSPDPNKPSVTYPLNTDSKGNVTKESINAIKEYIANNLPETKQEQFMRISGYSPNK